MVNRQKKTKQNWALSTESYSTTSLKCVLQNRGVGYSRSTQIIIYVIQGGQLHSQWFRLHWNRKSSVICQKHWQLGFCSSSRDHRMKWAFLHLSLTERKNKLWWTESWEAAILSSVICNWTLKYGWTHKLILNVAPKQIKSCTLAYENILTH